MKTIRTIQKLTLIALGIAWLFPQIVFTQVDSIFAFANSRRSARFAPEPLKNYKYRTAKAVFDELIKARGDFRMSTPTFEMTKARNNVAWMHPIKEVVGLEEKAYDVCTKFGADSLNAMAAFISHEIIHYYEKHDWKRHFINLNQNLEASTKLKQLDEAVKYETQADYLGGLLAISAGYNTYSIFEELLKKSYEAYGYDNQINGYPSLEDRIISSQNTAGRLKKLHSVYQTANLLTLVGASEISNQYYKHLLRDYQSYEVFNNAGVNAVLAALQLFDPESIPFALPLELDMNSRLDGLMTIRFPKEVEERRKSLLSDAQRWFESAIQLARKEPIAYLNRSVVYLLNEQWEDAAYYARKAEKLSLVLNNEKTKADALIVQGIIAALTGESEAAIDFFHDAAPGNYSLSKLNLDVLQGTEDKVDQTKSSSPKGVEQIEDLFLDDFLAAPNVETTAELSKTVFCGKKPMPHSELLLHYANEGDEYALFHQTSSSYNDQTLKNIKLGASKEEIIAAYGNPTRELGLSKGTCLIYKKSQILFLLGESDLLEKWVVFQLKLNK